MMNICEVVNIGEKSFLSDYRLDNMVEYSKGKLGDLKEWYFKSSGLGDLIGCVGMLTLEHEELKVVEYKGKNGKMYAIGL